MAEDQGAFVIWFEDNKRGSNRWLQPSARMQSCQAVNCSSVYLENPFSRTECTLSQCDVLLWKQIVLADFFDGISSNCLCISFLIGQPGNYTYVATIKCATGLKKKGKAMHQDSYEHGATNVIDAGELWDIDMQQQRKCRREKTASQPYAQKHPSKAAPATLQQLPAKLKYHLHQITNDSCRTSLPNHQLSKMQPDTNKPLQSAQSMSYQQVHQVGVCIATDVRVQNLV